MSERRPEDEPGFFATVVRFSALGLEMGAAVAIGVVAGWWLDQRFETGPWGVLGGVLLGGAAAARLVWRSQSLLRGGGGRESDD